MHGIFKKDALEETEIMDTSIWKSTLEQVGWGGGCADDGGEGARENVRNML